MVGALLRAVLRPEKLHRVAGARIVGPLVLHKAGLMLEPCWRRGLPRQRSPVPGGVFGVTPRTIWTQGRGPHNAKEESGKQVSVHGSPRGEPAVSTSQKVKDAGRDFTYLIVVVFGIGITGALLYVVFKELFSSSSPNKIYGKALEKCRAHPEVLGVFGEPIKGYGEMTRRGRRQHVSYVEYVKDGLQHIRLKFYIEGSEPGKHGTVHVEVKENPASRQYDFRYIFVEVEAYPRRAIVVEDNRS
ncbi:PREDICTED: mitochondrial import inner membrane translocase subunit Tim21 [Elephantulus edwardii]|uniref:mitochondrial import inner membrane translocase subunit Tim21 n=1 Tax=Elephantulus edwardii TaxID=28737 RepID=UPI0003F0A8F3|nr:PREDICTED: mitochondrial import inner membrane translocase subunit Tim21 [Elephantulus edwardii]